MGIGEETGFIYFEIKDTKRIRITFNGNCRGEMLVSNTANFKNVGAKLPVKTRNVFAIIEADLQQEPSIHAVYFNFSGQGKLDYYYFELL